MLEPSGLLLAKRIFEDIECYKANDIDGVKRRTRSGMGRCQGGFCQPYVAELIAKERGIDLTEVTKKGRSSKLLTGVTK